MPNKFVTEDMQIVLGIAPVNIAAGAQSGDWVNLKNYNRCAILLIKGVGIAGEDPVITVEQATSAAGAGAKALNFARIDKKQGTALDTIGQFTKVTQSEANTYTDDASGEVQAIWAIDIKAEDLDTDGGFTFLRASLNDPGTTSQLATVLYLLREPRYGQEALPSAIA